MSTALLAEPRHITSATEAPHRQHLLFIYLGDCPLLGTTRVKFDLELILHCIFTK